MYGQNGVPRFSKMTNADGYYEFIGLDAGAYTLNWVPSNYTPSLVSDTYYPVGGNIRSVSVGNAARAVANFSFAPGGTIAGRVTNLSGTPLADVFPYQMVTEEFETQAHQASTPPPSVQAWRLGATGRASHPSTTNANGEYTISGLASGTYQIRFFPLTPGSSSGYAFKTSGIITVTAPYTRSGANVALSLGGIITGRVTMADLGEAVPGRPWVYLEGDNIPPAWGYDILYSGTGVNYHFTNLPPGTYRLYTIDEAGQSKYIPEYYNNKFSASSATLVTVYASKTVSNVNFVLDPGAQVMGNVTNQWNFPLENIRVQVLDLQGHVVASATTLWDGNYLTGPGLMAGDYRVRFLTPALLWCATTPYATSYYSDGAILHLSTESTTVGINGVMMPLPPMLYLPLALRR
jgi:hypothetical protein